MDEEKDLQHRSKEPFPPESIIISTRISTSRCGLASSIQSFMGPLYYLCGSGGFFTLNEPN